MKKDSEKTQLEKSAKLSAEAEVKRMNAQKNLSNLEEKIAYQKKSQEGQETKVHELELKAEAEKQSLITDSKAIEQKAHELELMKASNIAIEKRMDEDKKAVALLESKK